MKKKEPKKQQIKVQLSEDDLKELFIMLKNFLQEEIGLRLLDTNHRIEMLQRRVTASETPRRVYVCKHIDKLDGISYSGLTMYFVSVNYKCTLCGRVNQKMWFSLSRKEKRALRKLGVEI